MIHSMPTHRTDGVYIFFGGGVCHHHDEGLNGGAELQPLTCLIDCGSVLLNRWRTVFNGSEGDASFPVDAILDDIITPDMNRDVRGA